MRKPNLKAVVGVAATVFFLWLALRGIEWAEVALHLRGADYGLLLAAVLVSTVGIHLRALRWGVLLATVSPDMPLRPRVAATAIGFAANNILPARVGEFVRAFVLARVGRIPVSAAFASLVVERVLDGFAAVALLLGAMAHPDFPLPGAGDLDARRIALAVLVVAVAIALALLVLVFFPGHSVRLAERLAGRLLPEPVRRPLVDALHAFVGGLGVLRSPRLLALSVGWVFFQWLFLSTSIYLAFLAFGITAPGYVGAVFMQSLMNMATALPAAPGFFGPFELAAREGLALWGVGAERAVSFAIGLHLGGYISVTGLGLWYAGRLGLSWRELGRSEEKVEEAVEDAVEHGESAAAPAEEERG